MNRYCDYRDAISDLRNRKLTISKIAKMILDQNDLAWERLHGVVRDHESLIKKIRKLLKGDRLFSMVEDFESRVFETIDKVSVVFDQVVDEVESQTVSDKSWGKLLKEVKESFMFSRMDIARIFDVSESSIFRMEHGLEQLSSFQKSTLESMRLLVDFELSELIRSEISNAMDSPSQLKPLYTILKYLYENPEEVREPKATGVWMESGLTLEDVKNRYIYHTVKIADGNKTKAAIALDIGSRTIYRKTCPEQEKKT